jgi:hypothetical protein
MPAPQRPAPIHPILEVPAGTEAVYANLVRIAHTPTELVLDFAHLYPGTPTAQVRARIVMSPLGAKLLHRALTENLQRFEAAFGEIKGPGEGSLADHLFRSINPPEPPPDSPPDPSTDPKPD